jgi:Pectate lyase superfamily protein
MADTKLSALTQGTNPALFYGEDTSTSKKYSGYGIVNVMDYGATGDGSTNDTAAIRAAINAMFNWTSVNGSNVKGATLWFPPGIYIVSQIGGDATDAACFELAGSSPGTGRIIGSGKGSTIIRGFNAANMIFNQPFGNNGLSEFSHMTITNSSTIIGSGCVRLVGNPDAVLMQDLDLVGMFCLEQGFYSGTSIDVSTTGSGTGSTPSYGAIGIHLLGGNVVGWDTSTGLLQYGLLTGGNTGSSIIGCRCEEAVTGITLGLRAGVCTLCTISGSVLTVTAGSHQYPDPSTGISPFGIPPTVLPGTQIIANGIPFTANVTVSSAGTGTGGVGTYNLSGAGGITISTPSPIVTLQLSPAISTIVAGFETEGCSTGLNVLFAQNCTIMDIDLTNNGFCEAATVYGSDTSTGQTNLLIFRAISSSFINCRTGGSTAIADWMLFNDPSSGANYSGLVIDNCASSFSGNTITTTAAFIDDGSAFPSHSGVAGKILSIPTGALNGGGTRTQLSCFGLISGAGIPTGANAPYISNGLGFPAGTLCSIPTTGGKDNAQYQLVAPGGNLNITGVAITCTHGQAFGVITNPINTRTDVSGIISSMKSGIQFRNNDNVNNRSMAMVFADLPDNSVNIQPRLDGMIYDIVDCNTTTFLSTAAGGGVGAAASRLVRYNATTPGWQVIG